MKRTLEVWMAHPIEMIAWWAFISFVNGLSSGFWDIILGN